MAAGQNMVSELQEIYGEMDPTMDPVALSREIWLITSALPQADSRLGSSNPEDAILARLNYVGAIQGATERIITNNLTTDTEGVDLEEAAQAHGVAVIVNEADRRWNVYNSMLSAANRPKDRTEQATRLPAELPFDAEKFKRTSSDIITLRRAVSADHLARIVSTDVRYALSTQIIREAHYLGEYLAA